MGAGGRHAVAPPLLLTSFILMLLKYIRRLARSTATTAFPSAALVL